jgi:cell division protein FtsB
MSDKILRLIHLEKRIEQLHGERRDLMAKNKQLGKEIDQLKQGRKALIEPLERQVRDQRREIDRLRRELSELRQQAHFFDMRAT